LKEAPNRRQKINRGGWEYPAIYGEEGGRIKKKRNSFGGGGGGGGGGGVGGKKMHAGDSRFRGGKEGKQSFLCGKLGPEKLLQGGEKRNWP